MVDVCGVIDPTSYHGEAVSLDGMFVFPVMWFYEMFCLNNLQINSPVMTLLDSSKVTERLLADFLLDAKAGILSAWVNEFRYIVIDLKTRKYYGIKKALGVKALWFPISFPGARGEATLPAVSPYLVSRGVANIREGVSPSFELKYNKVQWDYFKNKYPIKIPRLSPLLKADNIQVSAPRSNRRV